MIQAAKSSCETYSSTHFSNISVRYTLKTQLTSAWSGYFSERYLSGPPFGKTTLCSLKVATAVLVLQYHTKKTHDCKKQIYAMKTSQRIVEQPSNNIRDVRLLFYLFRRRPNVFAFGFWLGVTKRSLSLGRSHIRQKAHFLKAEPRSLSSTVLLTVFHVFHHDSKTSRDLTLTVIFWY